MINFSGRISYRIFGSKFAKHNTHVYRRTAGIFLLYTYIYTARWGARIEEQIVLNIAWHDENVGPMRVGFN